MQLAGSPLVARQGDAYCIRAEDEIAAVFAAAYGSADSSRLLPGLRAVATALQDGDVVRAMLTALHLRLGELSEEGLARVVKADASLKYNFDPAEPRDWHGSWTTDGGDGAGARRPIPAQELLPFAARPPLFFDEPPKTFRPFKEPIPRLSGKEGAKEIPSWARGSRPYIGENGRDFAKRLMDEKYGRDNWKPSDREYRQLQKFGDRNFRDPRSILLPDGIDNDGGI